jgi:hypothetical protein
VRRCACALGCGDHSLALSSERPFSDSLGLVSTLHGRAADLSPRYISALSNSAVASVYSLHFTILSQSQTHYSSPLCPPSLLPAQCCSQVLVSMYFHLLRSTPSTKTAATSLSDSPGCSVTRPPCRSSGCFPEDPACSQGYHAVRAPGPELSPPRHCSSVEQEKQWPNQTVVSSIFYGQHSKCQVRIYCTRRQRQMLCRCKYGWL